jgi:hypothetical protein
MMRPLALALLLLVLSSAGCRHYWVPERTLDEYASLSRSERRIALVPAQKSDGATAYVQARDARPLRALRDGMREVRVAPRGRVSVGIVLLIEGAALVGGAAALLVAAKHDTQCSNDACGAPFDAAIGGTLAGFGGIEMITGVSLIATGAVHVERTASDRRFLFLQ